VSPAKSVEPIEMPSGLWTRLGRRMQVLHGAHCRNLANTTAPSAWGYDAALCQITLITRSVCGSMQSIKACIRSAVQRKRFSWYGIV